MSLEKKFTPTSKRFPYSDLSLGYKFRTPISFEFGSLNGKRAIRYYINGEVESTRIIRKKFNEFNFKMYKVGGQTLQSVRRQREKCLEIIVRDLFQSYGFKVAFKPALGIYHPDVLITKGNLKLYLELKAYHESYLCGDAEISQVLKYLRESPKSKIGLITSGPLISYEESFLSNHEGDPVQYVTTYYKKLIISRSQLRSLDDSSRRDIYNQAAKKFKKNYKNGFPQAKVVYLAKNQIQEFPNWLSSTEKYDVLLLDSVRLMSLLKKENLTTQAYKLKLLKEKEQEHLIINGRILKF